MTLQQAGVYLQACVALTTVASTLLGAESNSKNMKGSIMASRWMVWLLEELTGFYLGRR